jgi:hypothetical protein
MQHKIREQVMDLTISGRLDAFRAQHLAGPFYYRQLLPALEKVFNELSHENEVIHLDQLELDLGVIPLHELETITWNNEWETIIREQITTALQEQRKNASMQRSGVNMNNCRQWLFYMERGYLDWNAAGFDDKAMISVLEVLATDYILVEKLRRLILKNDHFLLRIVRDHPESFLINLVEILTASAQQKLSTAVDELVTAIPWMRKRSTEALVSSKALRQQIWLKILRHAATSESNMPTGRLVAAVLQTEKEIPSADLDIEEISGLKTILPVLREVLQKKKVLDKLANAGSDSASKTKEEKLPEELTNITDDIDEQGIFVSHAGLVLLHPFLATFFKRLSLVADGKFVGSAALEKAIHLLHYLASGNTSPQEHELVIPKLLCALPLQVALKETIELQPEEKQEADDLLATVIEKWEKLKNISIDALRENFLLRAGKLYTKNDMRYLQVEGSSLDVLLDYLPWTLSIMKLAWMKEMVRIEWR